MTSSSLAGRQVEHSLLRLIKFIPRIDRGGGRNKMLDARSYTGPDKGQSALRRRWLPLRLSGGLSSSSTWAEGRLLELRLLGAVKGKSGISLACGVPNFLGMWNDKMGGGRFLPFARCFFQ
jgi:hypothetical protein